jgi:hypothetical protein
MVEAAQITAEFQYLIDSDIYRQAKPYYYDGPLAPEHEPKRTNLQYESKTTPVQDGRGYAHCFTTAEHGFKLMKHKTSTAISDGRNPSQAVIDDYLREVVELLRVEFETPNVIVFDYAVRGFFESCQLQSTDQTDPGQCQAKITAVHMVPRQLRHSRQANTKTPCWYASRLTMVF